MPADSDFEKGGLLMQVIVAEAVAEAVQRRIREIGLPVETIVANDDGTTSGDVREAECFFRAFMPAEGYDRVLAAAPSVRWVHTASAGVEGLLNGELAERQIVLTNSAGVHAIPIAEWVLHALLMIVKRGPEMLAAQRDRSWEHDLPLDELTGKTLTILGAGGIGGEVARRASPFDMQVWGVSRSGRALPHFDRVVTSDSWRDLLPETDFLVIAAPLTPETRQMVGAGELAQLPAHAWLVNVARGAIVDEPALLAALGSGTIAGAALDTFEQEPLPESSPLWTLPNVIISPHHSGSSPHSTKRVVDRFVDNLQRFLSGDELMSVVDPEAGY